MQPPKRLKRTRGPAQRNLRLDLARSERGAVVVSVRVLYCALYCNSGEMRGFLNVASDYLVNTNVLKPLSVVDCSALGNTHSQHAERTWAQGVVGSNPIAPTKTINELNCFRE